MPKFITIGYGDRAGYDRTDSSFAKPPTNRTQSCKRAVRSWEWPEILYRCAITTQPPCERMQGRSCVQTSRSLALP